MRQASDYLAAHPELYKQARERAHALGMIERDPLTMNTTQNKRTFQNPAEIAGLFLTKLKNESRSK
jgi:hypothetical protein